MKFKLERDWRIPGEAAAAMQYGFAIHTVLKHYYDPAAHAQEMSIGDAIQAFRHEFAKGYIMTRSKERCMKSGAKTNCGRY